MSRAHTERSCPASITACLEASIEYSGTFLALGLKHGDDDKQASREAGDGEEGSDDEGRREAAGGEEERDEEEHREAECSEEEQRDALGAADGIQSQA